MRRFIAFLVDATIAGLVARLGFSLAEYSTNRSLYDFVLLLATVGLLIAIFEHSHSGVTPGRLLTGTRLVSISGRRLTLFALFLRAEVLLLFPYCASFAFELIFHWVLKQEPFMNFRVAGLGNGYIAFLLFGSLFIVSKGSQSFHDYVVHTAVVNTNSSALPRRLSNRIVWGSGTLILAAITLWYFSFANDNTRLRRALNDAPLTQEMRAATMPPQLANFLVSLGKMEMDIPELYRYYDGVIYVTSIASGRETLEKLGLAGEPIAHFQRSRDEPIIKITALLTAEGMIDPAFQERFAKNVCSAANQSAGIRLCAFEFAYARSLLGPIHGIFDRQLITIRVDSSIASPFPIYAHMSPPGSVVGFSLSLGPSMEMLMRKIANLNPALQEDPLQAR